MVITGIWAEKKAIQQLNTQKRFPFWYIWIAALLDFAMSFVWLFAGLAGLEFSYEFLDFYLEFVALVIFRFCLFNPDHSRLFTGHVFGA